MWILSSEGDFFKGKSIWLRPGKKYLFGRVNLEGSPPRNYGVDHKSISRKHLVVSVAPVKAGDGLHLHTRSEVTIEDQGSKLGTRLDGQKIQSASKMLDGESHHIRIGNYEHLLNVKWFPVVITYSLSSKEVKAKDPLSAQRGRLEDLDIKTIDVYATEFTTHVVATKRNTPKGLEALINGKYIVTDSYIDAVVYAATPEVLDSPESLSPLEQDFDGAWPDPLKHLPAPGKEPTSRPSAAYAPDNGRRTVFEFYTFVFSDRNQYDNLSPAINGGHGKALLFEVTPGKTTIAEFMKYVKSVAEDKNLNGFSNPDGPGGVVIVTFLPKGHETWANTLYQEVAIQMDQRCAVQNEFLEAILAKDPSSMKRALEGIGSTPAPRGPPSTAPARTTIKASLSSPPRPEATQPVPPARRPQPAQPEPRLQTITVEESQAVSQAPPKRLRPGAIPKFRAFDDGFDMDSIPSHQPEPDDSSEPSPQITPANSFSAGPNARVSQTNSHRSQSKKRPAPSPDPDEEDDSDDVNSLLPAATAMKRRRLEIERDNRKRGMRTDDKSLSKSQLTTSEPVKKSKSKRKEIDVMEAARERREKADEEEKRDRENLAAELEGMDIETMRNLAVIEEMDIPDRRDRGRVANGDGERWDDRWNGRKNFKKFRRARDQPSGTATGGNRRRMQAVIVPLVEHKKKDFGIGEDYWDGADLKSQKRRAKEERRREKEVRSQQASGSRGTESGPSLRISGRIKHEDNADEEVDGTAQNYVDLAVGDDGPCEDGHVNADPPSPSFTTAVSTLQEEAATILGTDVIDVDSPRRTRAHDHDQDSVVSASPVQSKTNKAKSAAKGKGKGKRPAEEDPQAAKEVKKAKVAVSMAGKPEARAKGRRSDESDDDEGLKFRFKRKR